jgi:hypothetical protein
LILQLEKKMSLVSKIDLLIGRVAGEFRSVKTMVSGSATGDVSGLETTATNLVGAINEVRTDAVSGLATKADAVAVYTKAEADAALAQAVSTAALGVDSVAAISSVDVSVYADSSVAPMEDPAGRSGWHFRNAAAGQKINWYTYQNAGLVAAHTRAALSSIWAVVTFYDNRARPFINVYSTRLGDGQDAASWYRSRWVFDQYASGTPVANTKYLVFFGVDPGVHRELPRLQITDTVDQFDRGPLNPAEVLSMFSWGTNSAAAVGAETWTMHSQGYSIDGEDFSAPLVHVGATQAQLAAGLALKANAADVYTKAESDAALIDAVTAATANADDAVNALAANVYTIAQADAATSTAISTAVNDLIGAAPGTLDTLGEIAAAIEADQTAGAALVQEVALKAYAADVYTKVEADAALDLKADKADTYTKAEVDAAVGAVGADLGDASTDFVAAFEAALAYVEPTGSGSIDGGGLLPGTPTLE